MAKLKRGLPTLNQAKYERAVSLRRGSARLRGELFPYFWVWAALITGTTGTVHWKCQADYVAAEKARVMAHQREVATKLGPRVEQTVGRLEKWTRELAQETGPDVTNSLDLDALVARPGLYLRIGLDEARSDRSLRKPAAASLHDGLISCFFVRSAGEEPVGPSCASASECAPGLLCTEQARCQKPSQPFNLRLAYNALRVLEPEWTDRLHETDNDKLVRIRDLDLQRVERESVPVALSVMNAAEWFLVALDETPAGGLPKAVDSAESVTMRLQRTPHPMRLALWDLKSERLRFRVRVQADGQLKTVGASLTDPLHEGAKLRQVHACAAAMNARALVHRSAEETAAAAPSASAAPSGSAAPSASAEPSGSAAPSASASSAGASSASAPAPSVSASAP